MMTVTRGPRLVRFVAKHIKASFTPRRQEAGQFQDEYQLGDRMNARRKQQVEKAEHGRDDAHGTD